MLAHTLVKVIILLSFINTLIQVLLLDSIKKLAYETIDQLILLLAGWNTLYRVLLAFIHTLIHELSLLACIKTLIQVSHLSVSMG